MENEAKIIWYFYSVFPVNSGSLSFQERKNPFDCCSQVTKTKSLNKKALACKKYTHGTSQLAL